MAASAPWQNGGKGAPCPVRVESEEHLQALLAAHVLGDESEEVRVAYKTSRGDAEATGRYRIGSYTPAPDGTTRWLCLDFDGAGHSDALADPLGAARAAMDSAVELGLPVYLERSGSATGWHLWAFFEPGIDAPIARRLGHAIAPTVKLEDGTDADAKSGRGIEVFPKQDSIKGKNGLGNLVWVPWWHGAAEGGCQFCGRDGMPADPSEFRSASPDDVWDILARLDTPKKSQSKTMAPIDRKEWRARALDRLPLDGVFGSLLTGRAGGEGWLQCRDPWSTTGDRNPSAGVADGSGEAERGSFHSYRTGETLSVFDYLMRRDGVDFKDAADEIARLSGVPRSTHTEKKSAPKKDSHRDDIDTETQVAIGHELTDLGNAERLVSMHGDALRYTTALGWMAYDGKKWRRDDGEQQIQTFAARVARGIRVEAARQANTDGFKELSKHAARSENAARIRAMIELSRPKLQVDADVFDRDPNLFNVDNGVIDLSTGKLRPHNRDDLLSKISPVSFDEKATCSRWKQFLSEVFDGDEEIVRFVQRALGYTLTSSTKEQCFFLLHGEGANGKSTLVDTLHRLMGSYGTTTPFSTFTQQDRSGGGPRDDIAALAGVRFVAAGEGEAGGRLDEATIKSLTGGDVIAARHLYKSLFEFRPKFKIWLSTNHPPTIRGTDEAIWRRVRKIPFNVQFPEGSPRRDPDLKARLFEELPGILNWAIEGGLAWQREMLSQPEAVRAAVAEYREEQDRLGGFISSCLNIRKDAFTSSSDMFRAYKKWCEDNGERPSTQRSLARQLKSHGFAPSRTRASRGWDGVEIGSGESFHAYREETFESSEYENDFEPEQTGLGDW